MLINRPGASRLSFFLIFGVSLMATAGLDAEIKLPALISDHMVLQSDAESPLWGWANPGEKVTVTLGKTLVETKAGADGKWQVMLPRLPAGGPHTLEVTAGQTLRVNDVLVGEVWLGSGQSNMAMTVNRARDFEKEASTANFPQIRMFTVTSGAADTPQADCRGAWVICSPKTVGRFSATAYFFGRALHQALHVPVGLINSSVGGTPIESWINRDALGASPELQPLLKTLQASDEGFDAAEAKAKYDRDLARWRAAEQKAKAAGQSVPKRPRDPLALRERKGNIGGLFDGKIAPLIPFHIRGAIWYQGEANSLPAKANYYRYELPLLIHDWRTRWGYDFPFAWVQLPNFDGPGRDWPVVRQAMLDARQVPHTGMAITIDIGEARDIHPKNKQDVGKRLAMWALASVYGKPVSASGPLPKACERRGKSLVVSFRYADGGLVAKDGELSGFEVDDGTGFKAVGATIDEDQVIISPPETGNAVAVRYAWSNNPRASLFNKAGLPASPFVMEVEQK